MNSWLRSGFLGLVALSLVACEAATPTIPTRLGTQVTSPTEQATRSPSATSTSGAIPTIEQTAPPTIEPTLGSARLNAPYRYVKFVTDGAPILSALDGGDRVEWTTTGQIATVIGHAAADDDQWLRVQVGTNRNSDRPAFGWVNEAASEPVELVCPEGVPTLSSLAAMLPAQALECYGKTPIELSPVYVQLLNALNGEGDPRYTASPDWLAFNAGYWLANSVAEGDAPESLGMRIDPSSAIPHPGDRWVAVKGRFDHPDATSCRRASSIPLFQVANEDEAVLWCREQFVVQGLAPAEDPGPAAELPPDPGPPASRSVPFTSHPIDAPIEPRFNASGVWTGEEVIVWGGSDFDHGTLADGAAYTPQTDTWRLIGRGPLAERAGHLATWTGTEMLVWGGRVGNYIQPPDGAAYDPSTDRWRAMAPGPLESGRGATAAWTGSEWVIGSLTRDERTRFAAYDPATDSWRTLPSIDAGSRRTTLTAADDELLLWSGGGLSKLGAGAVDWVQVRGPNSYDVDAPIAWTGESLLARGWQQVDHRLFTFLAQWDGASGAWELLPQAPRDIDYGFVWADGRLLVLGADLIYDIDTRTWWEMTLPDSVDDYGDVAVWAGDRLFVWGGAIDKGTPAHEVAFVLTPDL